MKKPYKKFLPIILVTVASIALTVCLYINSSHKIPINLKGATPNSPEDIRRKILDELKKQELALLDSILPFTSEFYLYDVYIENNLKIIPEVGNYTTANIIMFEIEPGKTTSDKFSVSYGGRQRIEKRINKDGIFNKFIDSSSNFRCYIKDFEDESFCPDVSGGVVVLVRLNATYLFLIILAIWLILANLLVSFRGMYNFLPLKEDS